MGELATAAHWSSKTYSRWPKISQKLIEIQMLSAIAPAHALAARRGSHPERYLPDYNAFAQLLAPMGDLDAQPIEEMALPMLLKHCSDPVV